MYLKIDNIMIETDKKEHKDSESKFQIHLPPPTFALHKVFQDIKAMQKDNLNDIANEVKDEKNEEEIKGLKFIAKKLKILLEKNRKIQYSDASRILINNFANVQRDERNIKRRVYDAINVLVAANVIIKEGNMIEWNQKSLKAKKPEKVVKKRDLPSTENEMTDKMEEKRKMIQKLKKKIELYDKILKKQGLSKDKKLMCKVQNGMMLRFDGRVETVSLKRGKKKVEIELKGKNIKYCQSKNWQKFIEELHYQL